MKLRNKKTGQIIEPWIHTLGGKEFNSLAELNEEWEDYEEPKEYYAINFQGDTIRWDRHSWDKKTTNKIKEIGNYFETKEEAKKAVEKLKAWKRLKDKGFMFCGTDCIDKNNVIYFEFGERPLNQVEADEAETDLDLLFGGDE